MTAHADGPDRDFAGYGAEPPHAAWPGGARVALSLCLNVEEGAEHAVPDGDAYSEPMSVEVIGAGPLPGRRVLLYESMYEYGSRAGFWRVHRLLARRGLAVTAFACGLALERAPETARAMAAAGWEVTGHGWRWIDYADVPEATEREHVERTNDAIRRLCGQEPEGWFTGRTSAATRRLAAEAGCWYDSDSFADDLPYWVEAAGRPHLVVPYSLDANDFKFLQPNGFVTAGDFAAYLVDSLDQLLEEGEERPRLLSVGLHSRIVGWPGRIRGLERFLDHVAAQGDAVWVAARGEIARHWRAHHPPQGPLPKG